MTLPAPRIRPGQLAEIKGRLYRFERHATDRLVFVDDDGAPRAVLLSDFARLLETGQLEFVSTPTAAPAATAEDLGDEKLRNSTLRRLRYVTSWAQANVSTTAKSLQPVIDQVHLEIGGEKPGLSTVQRWITNWEKSGRSPLALVPGDRQRGSRGTRMEWDDYEAFREVLQRTYLRIDEPPATFAYRCVVQEFNQRNATLPAHAQSKVPSISTVYREIKKMNKYDVICCRKGKEAADREFRPVLGDLSVSYANHTWEVDHTEVDTILLDESRSHAVGRPWITAIIDRHSRMIVGFYLNWESPSRARNFECLRNAVLPKTYIKELYPDIRTDWPCYGVPQRIVPDNQSDFRSEEFVKACLALGVSEIEYTRIAAPWLKPYIERFLGNLTEKVFKRIPGTTYGDIFKRLGKPIPEHTAVCTMSELQYLTTRWICDDYHLTLHRELKAPPMNAWQESVKQHGVIPPPGIKTISAALSLTEYRVPSNKGIEYEGIFYNSTELARIRTHPESGKRIKIMIDPNNLGAVSVLDPASQQYVSVPARDKYLPIAKGKTLAQHSMARLMVKNHPEKFPLEFAASIEQAHKLISDYGQETFGRGSLKRRRRIANFLEGNAHRRRDSVQGDTRTASQIILDADAAEPVAQPVFPKSAKPKSTLLRPSPAESGGEKHVGSILTEGSEQKVAAEEANAPESTRGTDDWGFDLDQAARKLGMVSQFLNLGGK